jgi:hypothetical protein
MQDGTLAEEEKQKLREALEQQREFRRQAQVGTQTFFCKHPRAYAGETPFKIRALRTCEVIPKSMVPKR